MIDALAEVYRRKLRPVERRSLFHKVLCSCRACLFSIALSESLKTTAAPFESLITSALFLELGFVLR